jgi:hypothetical protein
MALSERATAGFSPSLFAALRRLDRHAAAQELQGKSRGATLGRHSLGAMYDVKETLQALFVRTLQASPHPLDILEQMHTAFTALFRVPLSPCWLATVHAGVLS